MQLLTILKSIIQWHLACLQCCATIVSAQFQNLWSPNRKSYPLRNHSLFPQFSQHPESTYRFSVSMHLFILDIFLKSEIMWHTTFCVQLLLLHIIFSSFIHVISCISQCFIPFYGWNLLSCLTITYFVYPLISWWTFKLLTLLDY